MRNNLIISTALSAILVLPGCATFKQADDMQSQTAADIASNHIPAPAVVETVEQPYLLGTPIEVVAAMPAIMNQQITFASARTQPLGSIAAQISQITGIPIQVSGLGSSVMPDQSSSGTGGLPAPPTALLAAATQSGTTPNIAVRYTGSLHGLLDTIASQAGISWRFDNGIIIFFRVETKTFSIPALAWVTKSTSDIQASAGASSSSTSQAGSSGGSTGTTTQSTGATDITNTSDTDVWKGIATTAKSIGDGAAIITDPSTGTITVTGTPDQIEQVSQWVQGLTDTLSKQVAITIKIYNVQLTNEQNYGFSPTLAFQNAAKSFGVSFTGAAMPAVQSGAVPFTFGSSILNTATGTAGLFSGSQAAVQALATLGNVNQVFSRDIVTLNGQESPIQVAQQIGYLQSSSSTAVVNVGTTASLTPGTVTTGFTGTITPRIVGSKIFLGMKMTISSLVSLKTVTSGSTSIQVPTTDDTQVQQSAALQSGSTLMITGYQENDGSTTNNGVGSPYIPILGGGADANVKKNLIAIVVTARTL